MLMAGSILPPKMMQVASHGEGCQEGAEMKPAFWVQTVLSPSLEVLSDHPDQPPELSILAVQSPMLNCPAVTHEVCRSPL